MSVGSALSHVHIPNHPLKDVETDEYLATEQLGPETGSSVWEYSHPIFYFRLWTWAAAALAWTMGE